MKDNFVIKWMKSYFIESRINEKNIKSLLHFSILWNFFEHQYFTLSNILTERSIFELSCISSEKINLTNLDKTFKHFQNRYLQSNTTNQKFENLLLNTQSKNYLGNLSAYEYSKNIIINEESTNNEKLAVLFFIFHRFRNNFFHGNKYTETLNVYKTEFRIINEFLIHYFESTAKDDLINRKRFG